MNHLLGEDDQRQVDLKVLMGAAANTDEPG
jgi:hypothetical protein